MFALSFQIISYYSMWPDNQIPHWKLVHRCISPNTVFKSVLDFGCGSGELAECLLNNQQAVQVLAIEIDTEAAQKASERLAKFSREQVDVLTVDGFSLCPENYDLVVFNPPMVPGELGFFCEGVGWCFLRFLDWIAGSNTIVYVMLFDYCFNIVRNDNCSSLHKILEEKNIFYEIEFRDQRIVHDTSPIWLNRVAIAKWFPDLKFNQTMFTDHPTPKRTIERLILKFTCYNDNM